MNPHTSSRTAHFSVAARSLHWLMAVLIIAMLIIGLNRNWLGVHEPIGILIFVLVLIRIGIRLRDGVPPLPQTMPRWQRLGASMSHIALYGLMVAMPLVGWATVSAEGAPIVLLHVIHLPPIAPPGLEFYRILRKTHMYLALTLCATFVMHVVAALYHGLILKDGVFSSMASSGEAAPSAAGGISAPQRN
jgi:cytochrome b561